MKTTNETNASNESCSNQCVSSVYDPFSEFLMEVARSRWVSEELIPSINENPESEEIRSIDWEGRHSGIGHFSTILW